MVAIGGLKSTITFTRSKESKKRAIEKGTNKRKQTTTKWKRDGNALCMYASWRPTFCRDMLTWELDGKDAQKIIKFLKLFQTFWTKHSVDVIQPTDTS